MDCALVIISNQKVALGSKKVGDPDLEARVKVVKFSCWNIKMRTKTKSNGIVLKYDHLSWPVLAL